MVWMFVLLMDFRMEGNRNLTTAAGRPPIRR
jgi:hypothetical protein